MSLNDVWEMYLFQILGSCLDNEGAGCEKDKTVFCGIEDDIAEKCFTDILANAKDYSYYVVISPDNELSIIAERLDDCNIILSTHKTFLDITAKSGKQEIYKQMIMLIRSSSTMRKEAV